LDLSGPAIAIIPLESRRRLSQLLGLKTEQAAVASPACTILVEHLYDLSVKTENKEGTDDAEVLMRLIHVTENKLIAGGRRGGIGRLERPGPVEQSLTSMTPGKTVLNPHSSLTNTGNKGGGLVYRTEGSLNHLG